MASMLYNPVETCTVIEQRELVIWLRNQATITHPVSYTHKHGQSHTQRETCVWKKIVLQTKLQRRLEGQENGECQENFPQAKN